jgi:uncharacterized protein
MRVFITGGTGLIGSRLAAALAARGDRPVVLTRSRAKAEKKLPAGTEIIEGDPQQPGSWMEAVSGCQGVVNLVGENLSAHRWSENFKAILRDSRLLSTRNLVEAIVRAKDRPQVLVSGSAVGYYGFTGDEELTEDSPGRTDEFLGQLCHEWEEAAKLVEKEGVRLVRVRTAVVLARDGGALPQMLLPFKLFLFGGKVGSGRQWVSWIHHADEVGIILFALDRSDVRGALNSSAPNPVTNQQLAQAIGKAMGRPSFFPTPAFMLKLAFGEMANLIVKGQRVLPKRVLELGYKFQFPDIDAALADIFAKKQAA